MFMYENGMNQSFVNINGKKKYKNLKWNADYNGEVANIYLKSNDNGRKKIYNFMLDNNDLANMLNVNTNDMLIDERLKQDFKQLNSHEQNSFLIELRCLRNIFQPLTKAFAPVWLLLPTCSTLPNSLLIKKHVKC